MRAGKNLRNLTIFILLTLVIIITLGSIITYSSAGSKALVVSLKDTMSEVNYGSKICLEEALEIATKNNVPLIIELDTYGGLLDAAFEMSEMIYRADVPVITFVSGAKAYSAGTLILLSSHIAAATPDASIGAMQPVYYDPTTGKVTYVNESKIVNPIIEKVRMYTEERGRNFTVTRKFVTENLVLSGERAKELGVIEFVAMDLNELIQLVNGRVVKLYGGREFKINIDGYEYYSCSLRAQFVSILNNPILNGILTSIGVLILVFSLISGHIAVSPLGLALILLGLIGVGFNINLVTIILLLLGSILLGVELFILPGFGIVGISGIVMLIFAFLLMPLTRPYAVGNPEEFWSSLRNFTIILGVCMISFTTFITYKVIKAKKMKPKVFGFEGKVGKAVDYIGPGKPGYVIIEGEYWKAESDEEIKPNEEVVATESKGFILKVKKKTQ